jgi:hypothetical protein
VKPRTLDCRRNRVAGPRRCPLTQFEASEAVSDLMGQDSPDRFRRLSCRLKITSKEVLSHLAFPPASVLASPFATSSFRVSALCRGVSPRRIRPGCMPPCDSRQARLGSISGTSDHRPADWASANSRQAIRFPMRTKSRVPTSAGCENTPSAERSRVSRDSTRPESPSSSSKTSSEDGV